MTKIARTETTCRNRHFRLPLIAAALLLLAAMAPRTHAAFVFTLQQLGSNVVMTGSGSFNIAALSTIGDSTGYGLIDPLYAELQLGPASSTAVEIFSGISGPGTFGPGNNGATANASSGSGDLAGLYGYGHFIYVPAGYVSGTQLSDTDTFNGATFASLGITSGTYTYTWGSGPTADTATVMTIASVPEPSTWAAILGGFGILGAVQRFRRQRGS